MARYRRNESASYAAGALSASTKPPRALTVQIGEPNVGTVGELGPVYGDKSAAILAKSLLRAGYPDSEISQIGGVDGAPIKGAVARDKETGEPVAYVTVQPQEDGRTPKGGGKRNPGYDTHYALARSESHYTRPKPCAYCGKAWDGYASEPDGTRVCKKCIDKDERGIELKRRFNPAEDFGAATVAQAIRDLVSDYGSASDRLTVSRLRLYLGNQASYSDRDLSDEIAAYRARLSGPRRRRF
jgi:hypothetical protein